ncbi:33067_t:CDS:1, partial [Gigaspora margarita]
ESEHLTSTKIYSNKYESLTKRMESYVCTWSKLADDISTTRNWPWSLEEMVVDKINSLKMNIKWIIQKLNLLEREYNRNMNNHLSDNFE